jgi:hypothetical protein
MPNCNSTGNKVLKLTTGYRARKIAGKHRINWVEILPLTAIAKNQDGKIKRFQEQQLEQGCKKSKAIRMIFAFASAPSKGIVMKAISVLPPIVFIRTTLKRRREP